MNIKGVSHINHLESLFEPESAALRLDLPVQFVISDKVDVLDPKDLIIGIDWESDPIKTLKRNLFSDVTGMESPSGLSSSILVSPNVSTAIVKSMPT